MSIVEAILLGLLQGFTEFLPVSSSGHLELGKVILGVEQGVLFTVVVHFATVCSIIIVFWKDIVRTLRGTFAPILIGKPKWNNETRLSAFLAVSIIPVTIVYVIWGDRIDALFEGRLLLVGLMLLCTALILLSTTWVRPSDRPLNGWRAFLVGVAQAVAVLPGISRSGATISAGLLLGVSKTQVTQFAFLMVLPPVIGAMVLELKNVEHQLLDSASAVPLIAGFVAALFSGLIACRWMIGIVRRGKISWFAVYCAAAGLLAVAWSQWK